MRTRALTRRYKKKANLGAILGKAGTFMGSEQGSAMMEMGAQAVGTAGDIMNADAGARPSMGGGIASGAGKGASMGMALGPWGAAAGAVIGGVAGGISAKKGQDKFDKLEEQGYQEAENKAIINSSAILENYDNKGTGVTSFEKGGIINYPFQKKGKYRTFDSMMSFEEGGVLDSALQPIAGGTSNAISEDAIQFNGYNPGVTDAIETQNAFVNHGETAAPIEEGMPAFEEGGESGDTMIFSQDIIDPETGKTFADAHKDLEKQKSTDPRFGEFNDFIKGKVKHKFSLQQQLNGDSEGENPQEAIAGGMLPMDANSMGGKEAFQGGGRDSKQGHVASKTPGYNYEAADGNLSKHYDTALNEKWGEGGLKDYIINAAAETGVEPEEFSAAMIQEGWHPDRFRNQGVFEKIDKETGKPYKGYTPEGGLPSSYYAIGLDTVGDYSREITAKTGNKMSAYNLGSINNEQGTPVQTMLGLEATGKNNYQQAITTAAGLYKYRSEIVGKAAEELGYDLTPEQRQYFNYMSYNTQHNAPFVGEGDDIDKSVVMMMKEFKTKKLLDKKGEEWSSAVATANNPYKEGSGKYNLYKNSSDAYARIAKVKGAYKAGDWVEPSTKATKTEEQWDTKMTNREVFKESGKRDKFDEKYFNINGEKVLQSDYMAKYAPKEEKEKGGYTNMNTLSAEHMKKNLTKRKKGKNSYQGGGIANINTKSLQDSLDLANLEPMAENTKKDLAAGSLATLGDNSKPTMPSINKMEVGRKQRVADAKEPTKKGITFSGIGDAIGTYGSDIANLFQKAPSPTPGTSVGRTKLERMNNKAELASINREARGAVKGLSQSSQNIDAASSSILAKKLQAQNTSNARNNKENIVIGNREAAIQAQQMATDSKKTDMFNDKVLGMEMADIKNRSTSLANMANKYMESRNQEGKMELDRDIMEMQRDTYSGSGQGDRSYEAYLKDKYKNTAKHGALIKRRSRKRKLA